MATKRYSKANPPTKDERKAAARVLSYYQRVASREVAWIDQERPSEWLDSLIVASELLKQDPDKVFEAYRLEYEAGHPDEV